MNIATLPNFRDLGGHRTACGATLRSGFLYRSVDLSRLDDAGAEALEGLGIRTVYDLRTAGECEERPDRVPAGARRINLDVLADAEYQAPAQLMKVFEEPRRAEELLGDGRAEKAFLQAYRSFVSLPSAWRAYRALFRGLSESSSGGVLFHCTTGKDRTGWAAASLLLLLGVDEDDVMADYLRTNQDLLPALRPIFDRFEASGGDPEVLVPVLGVREVYLRAALDEVETRFGGIRGYFEQGLGLSDEDLSRLESVLTAQEG